MTAAAVIIRSCNESALIGRTLAGVLSQDYPEGFEVIVVDSGSTDGTLEIVRSFGTVRLVEMAPADFTYGRALNLGARHAGPGTAWLVFLSAHAVPLDRAWLRNLVAPMMRQTEVAGVYGRQIPWPEHLENRIVRHLARNGYRECYGEHSFVSREAQYFSNANAAVRRECWQAQVFDEKLPYAEDWKWCRDVQRSGCAIAYVAEAAVWHSHAESSRQFLRRRRSEERGRMALTSPPLPRQHCWHYGYAVLQSVRRNARLYRQGRLPAGALADALVTEWLIATAVYLERRKLAASANAA